MASSSESSVTTEQYKIYANMIKKNNYYISDILSKISRDIYKKGESISSDSVDVFYEIKYSTVVELVSTCIDCVFVHFIIEQMIIMKLLRVTNDNVIKFNIERYSLFNNIKFPINVYYVHPLYIRNAKKFFLLSNMNLMLDEHFTTPVANQKKCKVEHEILATLIMYHVDCVFNGSKHWDLSSFEVATKLRVNKRDYLK